MGSSAEGPVDGLAGAVDIFIFLQARALNHHLFMRFCQVRVVEYYQRDRIRQIKKCLLNLKQKFMCDSEKKKKKRYSRSPGSFTGRSLLTAWCIRQIVLVRLNEVNLSARGPGIASLVLLKKQTEQCDKFFWSSLPI